MFHSARFKLTAWYLIIIMAVSILFSGIIYHGINQELTRLERFQELRQERIEEVFGNVRIPQIESAHEAIHTSRNRLILTLLIINAGIVLIAGTAGYFLAGQTLAPIQEMVTEQYRFISDASHEMRTPLTALRSEIEVGLRDKGLTLKETKELLASNLEEVIQLQQLSDNLLDLTRPRTGRLQRSVLSTNDLISEAIKTTSASAKKKKIRVMTKGSKEKIEGERMSLIQLLVILLDNAIKYSYGKGEVTITTRKRQQSVMISIKDTGIGIAEKDLPHVFDRFYRADTVRSRNGGHGLGLAIAKRIVEDNNGVISIESPQKGTIVKLIFPQP